MNENQQLKLKVCGLTQLHQIHELISMETDFLGFIFYEKSPRYVLNHLSLSEISAVQHHGKVGVFVNENIDTVIEIAERAGLHFIQLHGDEDETFVVELKKKLHPETGIIKVIRMGNRNAENESRIQQRINNLLNDVDYFLFDTDSKAFGGTGKTFDWTLLNEIKIPIPYFLSGGISEENIKNMETLNQKPFAADINSKFETGPGIKDVNRIRVLKEKWQF